MGPKENKKRQKRSKTGNLAWEVCYEMVARPRDLFFLPIALQWAAIIVGMTVLTDSLTHCMPKSSQSASIHWRKRIKRKKEGGRKRKKVKKKKKMRDKHISFSFCSPSLSPKRDTTCFRLWNNKDREEERQKKEEEENRKINWCQVRCPISKDF